MISFFKPYSSLKNYMNRFTLIHIGRLHIRIHTILSEDKTPFLHNHPFYYLSIILKGGYTEESEIGIKKFKKGSFIFRTPNFFHRLQHVSSPTHTLFITWIPKNSTWQIKPSKNSHNEWIMYPSGIYLRNLSDSYKYAKFDKFWYKSENTIEEAIKSIHPSINQKTLGQQILSLLPK